MNEHRACRNPEFDWQLKWWAFGGKFPLLPVMRRRLGDQQNTNKYWFHWMALRAWTMDSPDFGVEINLSDYCFEVRGRIPYLIFGLFFPLPDFVSRGHRLWRKPRRKNEGDE